MIRKIGAPRGGRVHWLLEHLNKDFFDNYRTYYNYDRHNYMFYRYMGYTRRLYDVFIIVRSSKRCFRLMYVNLFENLFLYRSFTKSRHCADFIIKTFNSYKIIPKIKY